MPNETYKLDATDKKLGRLATEVAVLLMGKNRTDFARNKLPDVEVEVENASKLSIGAKKFAEKVYYRHSGYPGGLKSETLGKVIETKGAKEALRRAVSGMLPKNKLRARMLKNLKIKN
ncbi:MAG: 50S ribosomal protein L13 [bacterium]|nr:50S ribosomal protein L13 [bacterium]